ncbi:pentapeptide repeat-containing protein [Acaryochloris marina]|uniref:Pentapeptide repeat family protein n=1 Tax=Acaryochloris marina (strain MBIC 11017) TaxID=329726 RepID=A8ZQQ4_ACAM1|nr:pentapeptide repeat-containing protein [Acaryochloris marina]ABW33340.1 pentapeptide repeat family protein [Acaryochloris marina MBIC11017]
MANPEHVVELKNGVDSWNRWRESHPGVKPDLSQIDLCEKNLSGVKLSEANLSQSLLGGTVLTKACLKGANLTGSYLAGAILKKADLRLANLSGIDFWCVDLSEANLSGVDLRGTIFDNVDLCGTIAKFSLVDGKTGITDCRIDDKTNFSAVGLDSARIEEHIKSKLKRNIRKIFWNKQYANWRKWKKHYLHWLKRNNKRINILQKIPALILETPGLSLILVFAINIFVSAYTQVIRIFWWISDYGSSTTKIICTFVGCSLFFSIAYLIGTPAPDGDSWPTPFANPFLVDFSDDILNQSLCKKNLGFICLFELWFRSLYFSVVTMTTLGFGEIHAHPLSITGQFLVMSQVLIGYVLLGALITRLSILFQNVG